MFSNFRKSLAAVLLIAGIGFVPAGAKADYHPTNDGGNFGLGIEAGDPGGWGITGKIWVDQVNAFQPAVKFSAGAATLQLDYLWHNFDVIHLRGADGEMPLYIGVGGDLVTDSTAIFAARVPLGISYIFDKRNVPVDIYFELVPTLWFYTNEATLDVYPEAGAHYYF